MVGLGSDDWQEQQVTVARLEGGQLVAAEGEFVQRNPVMGAASDGQAQLAIRIGRQLVPIAPGGFHTGA